jgi:hypothetical protein
LGSTLVGSCAEAKFAARHTITTAGKSLNN